MDLAAGWLTSISRRMALPSLVSTMPPLASSSIFSMARGPSVVRTMSATACSAGGCPWGWRAAGSGSGGQMLARQA